MTDTESKERSKHKPVSCPLFLLWVARKVNEKPELWTNQGVAFDAEGNPVHSGSEEACKWSFYGLMARHLPRSMHSQMHGLLRELDVPLNFDESIDTAQEFVRSLLSTARRMHHALKEAGIEPM